MKKQIFFLLMLAVFTAELSALFLFALQRSDNAQDAVAVNEIVHSVQEDWSAMERHSNETALDYVVLDKDGHVRFRTGSGLSESVHDAIVHRDTLLDIRQDGQTVGTLILYNDSMQRLASQKKTMLAAYTCATLLQLVLCGGYLCYLDRAILKPFAQLKSFASRVAGGNLDIPLTMDRQNLFGAFTESFDLMRSELKRARLAEAAANADKKELVAKLSHDIKTPVASIKAASEVGAALTEDEKLRDIYTQIIRKADQINTLITNLFSATLEELKQLTVSPADMVSGTLSAMLSDADYLHRASLPDIPECLLHADPLRLQQVFDNIFANSYKYADTQIVVTTARKERCLVITTEDYGGGVDAQELPLIKEKFRRGKNADGIEGAGLGLYIANYFMEEMQGDLVVENGHHGLRVSVCVALSGII